MKTVRLRLIMTIGLAGTLSVIAPRAQEAQEAQEATTEAPQIFRTATDVVTIQASVRDASGRVLSGLTATDFEIRDNGEVRPILSLRSDRDAPLSVAILIDMSGSMQISDKIAMARQAFESVLVQLRSGQDEAAVFTFDTSLHERVGFTSQLSRLKGALDEFQPFGATSLYDATAETARRLTQRTATNRAIVVLTDGIDTNSALSAAEVSGLASSIDVPVYVVATVAPIDQRQMTQTTLSGVAADLRDLADWSGGRLVFATTFIESVSVATNIVDELRQQYVLAIEAAPEREWRRLDVRVKTPSASVKARSGYFGG